MNEVSLKPVIEELENLPLCNQPEGWLGSHAV